jgi:hypothetical protein
LFTRILVVTIFAIDKHTTQDDAGKRRLEGNATVNREGEVSMADIPNNH